MPQRNTIQQKVVSERLAMLHGFHPTADEVYRAIHSDYPSISKATVYRILNKMAENGQALKVHVSSGADHFDDTLAPHCHVVCTECGRVDDVKVDLPHSADEIVAAANAPGYAITGCELLFQGLCAACSKERKMQ